MHAWRSTGGAETTATIAVPSVQSDNVLECALRSIEFSVSLRSGSGHSARPKIIIIFVHGAVVYLELRSG